MRSIQKLAKQFAQSVSENSDPESLVAVEQLTDIAEQIRKKANATSDTKKTIKMKEAAKLMLLAADLLSSV